MRDFTIAHFKCFKFNFNRKRLEFAPCAQTSFRSLLILAKNILLGLFVKPGRSKLTLLQRSIAFPAAGWKFSTRYRMRTRNARVSSQMHSAEFTVYAIRAGLLLANNSYRLSLRFYRNAKTLQKHCRMRFKHYETK